MEKVQLITFMWYFSFFCKSVVFWIHKDEIFEYLAKGRKNNKVQFKDPIVLPANIFCVTNVKNKMFFKASKKDFT